MTSIFAKQFDLFISRMISVTLSCMFWMVRGDFRLITLDHWFIGIQTGIASATALLLLTTSPFRVLFDGQLKNIISIAITVTIVDRLIHPSHFGGELGEGIATGITAALLGVMIGVIKHAMRI